MNTYTITYTVTSIRSVDPSTLLDAAEEAAEGLQESMVALAVGATVEEGSATVEEASEPVAKPKPKAKKAKKAKKPRITFGKMEEVHGGRISNDDGNMSIYVDGQVMGEILRAMTDNGYSTHEYRVGSYEVTIFNDDERDLEKSFEVRADHGLFGKRSRLGEVTARQALAAAKAYARKVLEPAR